MHPCPVSPAAPRLRPLRPQGPWCLPPQPLTAVPVVPDHGPLPQIGDPNFPPPARGVPTLRSLPGLPVQQRGGGSGADLHPPRAQVPGALGLRSEFRPELGFRLAPECLQEWDRKSRPLSPRPPSCLGSRGVFSLVILHPGAPLPTRRLPCSRPVESHKTQTLALVLTASLKVDLNGNRLVPPVGRTRVCCEQHDASTAAFFNSSFCQPRSYRPSGNLNRGVKEGGRHSG